VNHWLHFVVAMFIIALIMSAMAMVLDWCLSRKRKR
jgi:hypothetical protein